MKRGWWSPSCRGGSRSPLPRGRGLRGSDPAGLFRRPFVRICSAIFFSKFDSTLTEYQRFAIRLFLTPPACCRSCRLPAPQRKRGAKPIRAKRLGTGAINPGGRGAQGRFLSGLGAGGRSRRFRPDTGVSDPSGSRKGAAAAGRGSAEKAQHAGQAGADQEIDQREEDRGHKGKQE